MLIQFENPVPTEVEILEFQNGRFEHLSYAEVLEESAGIELPDDFQGAIVKNDDLSEESEEAYKEDLMGSVKLLGSSIQGLEGDKAENDWYCFLENGESEHCMHLSNREEELKLLAFDTNTLPIDIEKYRIAGDDSKSIHKLPSFQMFNPARHFVEVDDAGVVLKNLRGVGAKQPLLSNENGELTICMPEEPEMGLLLARTDGGFIGVEHTDCDGNIIRKPIECSIPKDGRPDSLLTAQAHAAGWLLRYDDVPDVLTHVLKSGKPLVVMGIEGEIMPQSNSENENGLRPCVLSKEEILEHLPSAPVERWLPEGPNTLKEYESVDLEPSPPSLSGSLEMQA